MCSRHCANRSADPAVKTWKPRRHRIHPGGRSVPPVPPQGSQLLAAGPPTAEGVISIVSQTAAVCPVPSGPTQGLPPPPPPAPLPAMELTVWQTSPWPELLESGGGGVAISPPLPPVPSPEPVDRWMTQPEVRTDGP